MNVIKFKGKKILPKKKGGDGARAAEVLVGELTKAKSKAKGIAASKPKGVALQLAKDKANFDALRKLVDENTFDVWVGYDRGDVYVVSQGDTFVVLNIPTKGAATIITTTKDQSDASYVVALRIIADWLAA